MKFIIFLFSLTLLQAAECDFTHYVKNNSMSTMYELNEQLISNTPSFNCKGEHTCQSKISLGHKCTVERMYDSPTEGQYKLKNINCCASTPSGGHSISFRFIICRPFF